MKKKNKEMKINGLTDGEISLKDMSNSFKVLLGIKKPVWRKPKKRGK
jgi:hypothetical protein